MGFRDAGDAARRTGRSDLRIVVEVARFGVAPENPAIELPDVVFIVAGQTGAIKVALVTVVGASVALSGIGRLEVPLRTGIIAKAVFSEEVA